MSATDYAVRRRNSIQIQARKQAALNLFYRIMSAEPDALDQECSALGLDRTGLTDIEIRRQLLSWHRRQMGNSLKTGLPTFSTNC